MDWMSFIKRHTSRYPPADYCTKCYCEKLVDHKVTYVAISTMILCVFYTDDDDA